MHVQANLAECVASGQCLLIAPEVFEQHDDGKVVLINDSPPFDYRRDVREAAVVCPSEAIKLTESPTPTPSRTA